MGRLVDLKVRGAVRCCGVTLLVSAHALERYLERVVGLDPAALDAAVDGQADASALDRWADAVAREALPAETARRAATLGNGDYRVSGEHGMHWVIVRDRCVVTVVLGSNIRAYRQPKLGRADAERKMGRMAAKGGSRGGWLGEAEGRGRAGRELGPGL